MCGICGIIQIKSNWTREELTEKISAMSSELAHRGPDGHGIWIDPNTRLGFGHRRLSIVDLSSDAGQPMTSHDGRFIITFNGEIYNYLELKRKLLGLGARFTTQSDTEILLESYRYFGTDCLNEFDGMFAFVLYDTREKKLFAARDPFGEKPFYYSWSQKGLVFASELRAIACLKDFDRTTNKSLLTKFLCLQYFDGEDTIYQSVRKLKPGHFFTLDMNGTLAVKRYFEFRPGTRVVQTSENDLVDELEEILLRNMKRRLHADVPVGGFLSGGVDSATVMALATKKLGVDIQTFTIGFKDWKGSEHQQAERIAQYLGTRHTTQLLTSEDLDLFDLIAKNVDEPNADTSLLPTWFLSKMARRKVKVAISGDGADELFGGYDRYFATLAEEHYEKNTLSLGERYYSNRIMVFTEKEVCRVVGQAPEEVKVFFRNLRNEMNQASCDPIHSMRKTDVEHYMPGAVLSKVDRMSMRNALEVRTPFLNPEMARFAEKVPVKLLANGQNGKILLKKLACRYLPEKWVHLPKRGFGLPTSNWGEGKLYDGVYNSVVNARKRSDFWIDADRVKEWLSSFYIKKDSQNYKLWCLIHLKTYVNDQKVLPDSKDDLVPWFLFNLIPDLGREKTLVFSFVFPEDLIDFSSGRIAVLPLWAGKTTHRVDWLDHFPKAWDLGRKMICGDPLQVVFHGCSRDVIASNREFLIRRKIRHVLLFEQGAWKKIALFEKDKPDRQPHDNAPLFFNVETKEFIHYDWQESKKDLMKMMKSSFNLNRFIPKKRGGLTLSGEGLFSYDTPKRSWKAIKELVSAAAFKRIERHYLARLKSELAEGKTRTIPQNRRKKIVFILPNLSPGGAERQACNLMIQLKKRGFDVILFVLFAPVGEGGHYAYLLEKEQIKMKHIINLHGDTRASEIMKELGRTRINLLGHSTYFISNQVLPLFSHIFAENPNMVVCLLDIANLAGGIGALMAGVPKVVTSFRNINPTPFSFYQNWYLDYYRTLITSPNVVLTGNSIFGNESYAKWLKIPKERIWLLRNGLDFSRFRISSDREQRILREKYHFGNAPVMGGIFRLSPEKRPELFIEVFIQARKKIPDLKAILVGNGPMRRDIEQLIHSEGISESVWLAGCVENVAPYLSIMNVLVQTSNAEGTANTVIEAQYLKKPVVVTSGGGASESLLSNETGYLITTANPNTISDRVVSLIEDQSLAKQMGEKGHVFVKQTFSLQKAVDDIVEYGFNTN